LLVDNEITAAYFREVLPKLQNTIITNRSTDRTINHPNSDDSLLSSLCQPAILLNHDFIVY